MGSVRATAERLSRDLVEILNIYININTTGKRT